MKKILIFNGAGKKFGNTAAIVKAFTQAAVLDSRLQKQGNTIRLPIMETSAIWLPSVKHPAITAAGRITQH